MLGIDVPKPEMSEQGKINFATECAFGELLKQAKHLGLELNPVMGLMYMPTQEVTWQWQQACRAVLEALKK